MTQRAICNGAWPILLTAFDGDNALDLPVIGALLDFYRDLELPGVLALGQASEMLLLDHDERLRVAECVARHPRAGLAAATVGNYGETLAEQADCLQRIHDMGTDVAVVALSLLPSPQGLAEQLLELAKLVKPDLRLGIYEIPEPEHRLLSPDEVAQVAASGRFCFHERHLPPDRALQRQSASGRGQQPETLPSQPGRAAAIDGRGRRRLLRLAAPSSRPSSASKSAIFRCQPVLRRRRP